MVSTAVFKQSKTSAACSCPRPPSFTPTTHRVRAKVCRQDLNVVVAVSLGTILRRGGLGGEGRGVKQARPYAARLRKNRTFRPEGSAEGGDQIRPYGASK